jgi:catechol 2,3-dioxygenase-like lactoylglutathione lyase family enzyme
MVTFRIEMMFHPTLTVPDPGLEQAEKWFEKTFGRKGVRWEEKYDFSKINSDYPVNYSFFIHLADVVLDVLYLPLSPRPDVVVRHPLDFVAWYTDNAVEAAEHVRSLGVRCWDLKGPMDSRRLSPSLLADDILFFFTEPEDTGICWEVFEMGEAHRETYSVKGDPRLRPDWSLPSPSEDDPLQLEHCSHHTFLTQNPKRVEDFCVNAFQATPKGKQYNRELDADSTFFDLAGSVLEFAVLRPDSPYQGAVDETSDRHFGMSFKVGDLGAVEHHLASVGVKATRTDGGAVVVEPVDGYGVQWRFIDAYPYSG